MKKIITNIFQLTWLSGRIDSVFFSIKLYYALLFFILYWKLWTKLKPTHWKLPSEPLEILAWLPHAHWNLFLVSVGTLGLCSITAAIISPHWRWARIGATVSILFVIGIESCYGKVTHGFFGWLWSSAFLIFLPNPKTHINYKDQTLYVLFLAQVAGVLCYTIAGLWKLRTIPKLFAEQGIWPLVHSLNNTIAYEHVFHEHKVGFLTSFFLSHDYLSALSFVSIILLQTFSVVIVLMPRWHIYLGSLLIFFHVMSEILINIPFRAQAYLIGLQLIVWPLIINRSKTQLKTKN
jgi:hypothetical protein